MNAAEARLPEMFRPILWSYDFSRLDANAHRNTIITHALLYGTLSHWRWIKERYGDEEIRRTLARMPASGVRPKARPLIETAFDFSAWNHAPRGAH